MSTESQPDYGPKTWRVKCYGEGQQLRVGDELMTSVEAVHEASVLNERDEGRGVKWVAVQDY